MYTILLVLLILMLLGALPYLALQPVLGILPERRIGAHRRSRAGTASGRPSMTFALRRQC